MPNDYFKLRPSGAWRTILPSLVGYCFSGAVLAAQLAPQDNWAIATSRCCDTPVYGLDFDDFGNLFVATATGSPELQKRDREGSLIVAVPIPTAFAVRVGSDNSVYISTSSEIKRFTNTLDPMPAIPIAGVGAFDVLPDGRIVRGGAPLSLFNADGSFVNDIGVASCAGFPGAICNPYGVATDISSLVYVYDAEQPLAVKVFSTSGNFIRAYRLFDNGNINSSGYGAQVSSGGLVIAAINGCRVFLFSPDGTRNETGVGACDAINNLSGGIALSPSGDIVLYRYASSWSGNTQYVGFRSLGPTLRPRIPQPRVLAVKRRAGSTINDIEFIVRDEDDSVVAAYPLAFRDGTTSLATAVRLETLVEGTEAGVGAIVPVNSVRHLAWDAAADLGTSQPFVAVDIQILAKDSRGLIDLDFVEIPAGIPSATDPALVIVRSPVRDYDLLQVWFWLVASNDPRIVFSNGEVRGNIAPYEGKLLASGSTFTADGRSFVFETLLGLREATLMEITRAREATTPGLVNQFPPRNSMGGVPVAVNQFSIDTGAGGGYWVVMP